MIRIGAATIAAAIALGATAVLANQSAQIAKGKEFYTEYCQLCHGADGKRGEGFQTPIWGPGALIGKFGDAQGLIDYMQIMPFNDPTLLEPDQKLAVIAYILANHGVMPSSATLDPKDAGNVKLK